MLTRKTAAPARAVQCKKGFTLTEIAIVLGIIGIILGAVWAAASSAYIGANATKFQEQMNSYLVAARTYCGSTTCSATTLLPTLTANVPTLGSSTVNQSPTTNATAGGFTVSWTLPVNSANTCIAMATGLNAITSASVADTVANAASGLQPIADTDGTANGCSAAGATPTKCQTPADTNIVYNPLSKSCSGMGTNALGFCTQTFVPTSLCQATTTSLAAAFSLTY